MSLVAPLLETRANGNGFVRLIRTAGPCARRLSFVGPAFAVSIGYMDPGNWATDLSAGGYGLRLLWVILAANTLAIVLQLAVTHYTVSTGAALGGAIAGRWPRLRTTFWVVFQGAAIATDLAEFTGIVLGLQLLLHVGVAAAVVLALASTLAFLIVGTGRRQRLERSMVAIVALIGASFFSQLLCVKLDGPAIAYGALVPNVPDHAALVIVIAIVGATVMPHNLFLHSSLIQASMSARRVRGSFFVRETIVALSLTSLVNGAILIVGASLRHTNGSIEGAYASILGTLGPRVATTFAVALLLSGLAASVTATVSGDFIFRAFSKRTSSPAARRLITLLPAAVALAAGVSSSTLLIWSQVILALVLPVAVVPLLMLMRNIPTTRTMLVGTYAAAGVCLAMDGALLVAIH